VLSTLDLRAEGHLGALFSVYIQGNLQCKRQREYPFGIPLWPDLYVGHSDSMPTSKIELNPKLGPVLELLWALSQTLDNDLGDFRIQVKPQSNGHAGKRLIVTQKTEGRELCWSNRSEIKL
jgi:hypothetical protein